MGEIKEKKPRAIKVKNKETKIGRDIRLTFKEDEQDIREYLESKSSATCFLKDLARLEMQREKKMLESAYANSVLEQIMQLLNQKEPKAPVFNLTANFEGAIPMVGTLPQGSGNNITTEEDEEEEEEIELDISDLI